MFHRQLHGAMSCQSMGRNCRLQFKVEIINDDQEDQQDLTMYDEDSSVALDDLMEGGSTHSSLGMGPFAPSNLLGGHQECSFDLENSQEWDDLLLSEAYHYQSSSFCLHDETGELNMEVDGAGCSKTKQHQHPPLRELLKETSSRRMLMDGARQHSSRRLLFAMPQKQVSSRRLLLPRTIDRECSTNSLLSSSNHIRASSRSLLSNLSEHKEETRFNQDSIASMTPSMSSSRHSLLARQNSSSRRLLLARQQSSSRRKLFASAKQSSSRRFLLKRQISSHRMMIASKAR